MNDPKNPGKLNLDKKNVPQQPHTPEDMAKVMSEYYSLTGNAILNLVPIMDRQAFALEEICTELSDIKEYVKIICKRIPGGETTLLTDVDIDEVEKEEDGPEGHSNAESPAP